MISSNIHRTSTHLFHPMNNSIEYSTNKVMSTKMWHINSISSSNMRFYNYKINCNKLMTFY